jgi:MoaA/NifB/PqqE/SkfB family radical SAM enzyme
MQLNMRYYSKKFCEMFKFEEIRQVHLEITNNCQASCPMCNRNVDGGLPNPLIKINDWSLEDFKKIMNQDLLNQIHSYFFCGTFGDPILNNNLIDMCRYTTEMAPNIHLALHTNGGARNEIWWKELAHSMPKNHRVVFALDGLADTHHLYRVGTRFETVIKHARAFIAEGGTAEWVFLKFKHNQHQVEKAEKMSKDLGFKYFTLKNSSRFVIEPIQKVVDKNGIQTHVVEPATDSPLVFIDKKAIAEYKKIVDSSVINCKAQQDREIYIDAYKDFYPCCWMANTPYSYVKDNEAASIRNEIKKQHDAMLSRLGEVNLLKRPLKDIINSQAFQTMWNNYWHTEKLIVCARSCGKSELNNYSKCTDQEIK